MIFEIPCNRQSSECSKRLSIIIENLGSDFFSVNFCVDMNFFPHYLAYNLRGIFLKSFDNKEIFENQVNDDFFNLDDRRLMIRLIQESFVYMYRREEIIQLNLYPREYDDSWFENYDLLFDNISNREENRDKLWEIDSMEYTNNGYFIFIVNHLKNTKVVFISYNKNLDDELGRFCNPEAIKKNPKFFDESIWSVRVVEVYTAEFLTVIKQIINYLSMSNDANSQCHLKQ
ncbi:hypothetical protein [Moraxella catarrhalis]|uniref:hypothetical protein n=1 Tax=Moraxella catarrhalis TaxID=480 RepID=UPI0013D35499|nr:hypothetical protein [Moraxella catarrhalis]